jgi:hypothetical protein
MSGMAPRIARLCRFSAWAGARLYDALAALRDVEPVRALATTT